MAQFVKKYKVNSDPVSILETLKPVTQINWSNFIMAPGVYQYNTPKYDLSEEGLYLIFNSNVDGGYRHIYQSDVKALMSSLAKMINYGRSDENLSNAQLLSTIKTRKVAIRCGRTADFVRYVLLGLGIQSRVCRLLTAETPNNFDDGHVVLEVKIDNQWVLFDIPSNRYWGNTNLDEYFNSVRGQKIDLAESASDNTPNQSYNFATDVFYDMFLSTENLTQTWINRIYQIPGIIDNDGLTYFYTPLGTSSRASWVLGLDPSYRILDYPTWKQRFYQ